MIALPLGLSLLVVLALSMVSTQQIRRMFRNVVATTATGLVKGVYVSGDEVNRADARILGFETVYQHPIEVGRLGGDEVLVVDFDNVLFGDVEQAIQLALEAARSGVTVAIQTYDPENPRFALLHAEPGITWEKNLQELFAISRKLPRSTVNAE